MSEFDNVTAPPPAPAGGSSNDDRTVAMLVHLSAIILGFIVPLIVWLINKDKPEKAFLTDQSKEALNFNLSMFIYACAAGLIALLLLGATVLTLGIGIILTGPAGLLLAMAALAIAVLWLVCSVIAAFKAYNGETYRYPLTLRLVS